MRCGVFACVCPSCSVLRCVAVCCGVLLCVAAYLQVAVYCSSCNVNASRVF